MTWDEIATQFDVKRCPACDGYDHTHGAVSTNTVHWADRHLTRHGLRHYLMLIAQLRLIHTEEGWRSIYAQNVWAISAARQLHVRIPARYSDNDRARVRWLITKDEAVPANVKRWARGRST